ncbi:TonB-dependent receptor, partial [Parvibaculum sp.]|uniref:TonB-dependent receptor n=1 Tax=Parvibaculum sp. TaxID=2024848 RepID=UPI002C0C58C8
MGRSRSTNSVRASMAMGAGALAVFGLGGEVARAAEQTPATAPAEATATAASDTAEAKNILDTIVVTAQRRKQSLSEVPLAVSVVSGDQFQDAGLSGVDDLQKVAPSITFSQSQSTRGSGMNIRGIGTTTFADGIEGSVGYVVDGVVVGREGGALSDLGDIERVEILRGPQGTLFGKNATAGVINLVTKRPTEDFEAEGRASYGSYNEVKVSGAASGPLTEDGSLLGRFSFFSNTRDGNV